MMTVHRVPKPSTSAPPLLLLLLLLPIHCHRRHPSARFRKDRILGRWSERESGEAFWYAQRVVDVERFRRRCCCRCCLLPSAFHSVSHSVSACLPACLPVCLFVSLSLSLCLLYEGLGGSPVWAACHHWGYSMYSLPCASYFFFPLVSFCLSPLSTLLIFFLLFFFISAWRLVFDSICWAKACRWGFKQGGELWLSPLWVHFEVLVVVFFKW